MRVYCTISLKYKNSKMSLSIHLLDYTVCINLIFNLIIVLKTKNS